MDTPATSSSEETKMESQAPTSGSRFVWTPKAPKVIAEDAETYRPMAPKTTDDTFLKGVCFSPDGTCLMSVCEDANIRMYAAPSTWFGAFDSVEASAFKPWLTVKQGEPIYDCAWYPKMAWADASSCCFITSCRGRPIHLLDGYTGTLRTSYRAFDNMDEIVAANSVCFSPDGSKIYGGYNRMVRVFDTIRPGREYDERPTSKTRKSQVGQRGLISCLATHSTSQGVYAAGSFAGTVYVYDGRHGAPVAAFQAQSSGVTQVQFSPDGVCVFSGARRHSDIFCWDLRKPESAVYTLKRASDSNQRIGFDLDVSGQYLITGSQDGAAMAYNLSDGSVAWTLQGAPDCVSDISCHPAGAVFAMSTGQRHFVSAADVDEPPAKPLVDPNRVIVMRTAFEFGA